MTTLVSPFFGGGSLELYFAKQGVKVIGYDYFRPVVNFWNSVIYHREELVKKVRELHPLSKNHFRELQNKLPYINDKVESGAVFFTLNRSSFSGSTLSGGMSPNHPRFNQSSIERLEKFKIDNIEIHNCNFEESINNHRNEFMYLDPPYYIKSKLYGNKGDLHKEFNHELLCEILKSKDSWILSYNNDEYIKDLYKNYEIIYPEWTYGMSKNKESKEILILNC